MRTVIKVGTSTLAHSTGRLNIRRVEELCKVLSDIKNSGHEVILVSSGAIGMGAGKLNLKEKPTDIATRQAAASVGQCELMYTYDKLFSEYNHTVSQILLTNYDVTNEKSHTNFKNTIFRLLELDVLPIINENDTVSTDELEIGDNDTLAAIVAESIGADLLVILSDISGLYTSDPRKDKTATLIPIVEKIDDYIRSIAGTPGSRLGSGGMITKIKAAEIATSSGCDMIICSGDNPDILYNILDVKNVGTKFIKKQN